MRATMKKNIIPIFISILLLGGIIYFSNASKIISIISKANTSIIIFILVIWIVDIFLRSWRWWYLLKKTDINVPYFQLVKIFIPGLFISNITPAKTGDPVRSILLKQTNNIGIGRSISSILFERIMDIFALIFLAFAGIPIILTQFPNFLIWFILAILVYFFGIGLVVFLVSSKSRTKKFVSIFYFIFSFIPLVKKSKKKLNDFSVNLSDSFSKFGTIKILSVALFCSLLIWGLEGAIFYLAFLSLGFKISILIALSAMAATTLISVLSFLPGGIGSAELVYILIFTNLFSLTISQVTSAALIGRIPFLMSAITGAIFLTLLKYKYKIL
jgi:uncharacterized protein (TIRG00374 family)